MKARIPLAASMVCALGCLLAAAPAGATVTSSDVTVTSPTGTYLIADEVTPKNSITGTGTSNGTSGDSVDVGCYFGNGSNSLVSSVAVAADGTFSFSGTLSSIARATCVLRAVPHGDASAHPPGTASTFTGPTLAIGDNTNSNVSGGPNDKALEDYHLDVSQPTGGFDYDSLGGCSISDSWVFDPITFAQSPPLDYCNAWFWWRNGFTNPGYQPPTRSELQVDGTDAFLPAHISNIATTEGFPATSNPGLPSLTYSYSIDPASGNLALDETDQVVKCSPGGAYPPTASNCSSFVPTGIQIRMHIVQGHGGRVATVTQWISSTDGRSHAVNLLENNEFYVPSHDGELNFPWSGGGMQPYTTVGQVIPGPGSAPGSFFIKGSAAAADGSETAAQGSTTFSTAPDSLTIVGATNTSYGWVDLLYQRTVPATGSLALGFTYSNAFLAGEVAADATAAEAAFRPGISISSVSQGAGTAPGHVTVVGNAGDTNGTPAVAVNGLPAALNGSGVWSVQVPVKPGANAITATATNVFGNTASTTVTYTAPAPVTLLAPPLIITRLLPTGPATATASAAILRLTCQAARGAGCSGTAQLSTLEKLLGTKILAVSARSKKRHNKRVVVGSTTFSMTPGQTKAITVPLNALGRRLLARFKRLPATMTITLTSTTPPTRLSAHVTIKAKAKKKKKKKH